jgi:uncharacterized protein (DUF362 family)
LPFLCGGLLFTTLRIISILYKTNSGIHLPVKKEAKMTVALIHKDDYDKPIENAIRICDGFNKLKADSKVLIKPNLVIGGRKGFFPPFGRVTSAAVIREIVECLKDAGCKNIRIGEGSAVMKEIESDTQSAFHFAGMDNVAKRYGIKLVDFEAEPYERLAIEGHKFSIAKAAIETDFLINVPVLKTHGQTIVSLGMKNLKGCLKYSSKKRFHKVGTLSRLIALLNQIIHSHLTIIDGTFALDHGPTMGDAYRMDLIVAGTDIFETELVGAALLGKKPSDIKHIKEFAQITDRILDIEHIEIVGRKINEFAKNLPYESDLNRCFSKYGLKGIHVSAKQEDPTICSACLANMEYPNYMFAKDNPGRHLNDMDICIGKGARPNPNAKNIVLFGDCSIKHNDSVKNATLFRGCPPDMGEYLKFLMKSNLSKGLATKQLISRLIKMVGFKLWIYKEDFGFWEKYQSKEFDLSLYE